MLHRTPLIALALLTVPLWFSPPPGRDTTEHLEGTVTDHSGMPLANIPVTARSSSLGVAITTVTDSAGRFRITTGLSGPWQLALSDTRLVSDTVPGRLGAVTSLVAREPQRSQAASSSRWLALLPDGIEKRRFILDCTGCHQFNETRAHAGTAPRTAAQWSRDITRMLGFAGAGSGFPVIASDRDPDATAEWLVQHLGEAPTPAAPTTPSYGSGQVTEYDLPIPADLPHDLAIDPSGRVVITGMLAQRMYSLDPATGLVETVSLPQGAIGPRAIDIDQRGRWVVLFGSSRSVGRHDPATGTWQTWPIGVHPHSVALAADGEGAWFNNHFARDPITIARLDLASGRVQDWPLSPHPDFVGDTPVPYELRRGPQGGLWMSELLGNRVHRLDPGSGRSVVFEMPVAGMGPRRLDVAHDGTVWIPAYAANALVELDPTSGHTFVHPLPVPDAVPYVARVHPITGDIWLGTAAADLVFRFTPSTGQFTAYPIATRGASMRHLAIDSRTGDVWVAYGASPAVHTARVARLQPGQHTVDPTAQTTSFPVGRPAEPIR